MRKHHYFEFMDLKYFPRIFREVMTDTLTTITQFGSVFDRVAVLIGEEMKKNNTNEILDLCSGAGGPWRALFGKIKESKPDAHLILTDLYPNNNCLQHFPTADQDGISYEAEPVNATDVPVKYKGIRTFFGSFHHMSPVSAVKVLEDAARKNVGIIVAESYSREPAYLWSHIINQILICPFYLILLWFLMWKSIKGNTAEKLVKVLFTHIIPIIPLCFAFDTFISGVRVYVEKDLQEMIKNINVPEYRWQTGTLPKEGAPSKIAYIIGTPV